MDRLAYTRRTSLVTYSPPLRPPHFARADQLRFTCLPKLDDLQTLRFKLPNVAVLTSPHAASQQQTQ